MTRNEVAIGLTNFITITYTIFVKPQILSSTGMDFETFMVPSCLSSL
ncbi:MAG: hypothetical protein AB9861_14820 [Methanosarcina sp.]